jgi:hypothetical protein
MPKYAESRNAIALHHRSDDFNGQDGVWSCGKLFLASSIDRYIRSVSSAAECAMIILIDSFSYIHTIFNR